MAALPPKGDPRRPLYLAIRSCRLLGFLLTIFGGLMVAVTTAMTSRAPMGAKVVMLVVSLLVLGPGVAYILISFFLKKKKPWAVVLGLVVASLHCALGVLSLLGQVIGAAVGPGSGPALPMLLIQFLIVAALAQLIVHLSKSFEAIRAEEQSGPRGFEPVGVRQG